MNPPVVTRQVEDQVVHVPTGVSITRITSELVVTATEHGVWAEPRNGKVELAVKSGSDFALLILEADAARAAATAITAAVAAVVRAAHEPSG